MNFSFKTALVLIPMLVLIAGCSSTKLKNPQQSDSRYTLQQDTGPSGGYDISNLQDAVPTREPYSRGGNRSPYTVWGKSYNVMASGNDYEAVGIASWYGAKFHGHKTSNGETYDMYAMSAAHRSLPLPSFVEVTNLANNRRVIVRVNDRGPFHSERIIDLSYAAAKKLGFSDKGTAKVRIAGITVSADGSWRVAGETRTETASSNGSAHAPGLSTNVPSGAEMAYVQVGAFRDANSATAFQLQVKAMTEAPVNVVQSGKGQDGWHRVHIGPFETRASAEAERDRIQSHRLGQPIIVMRGNDV